MSKRIIAFTLIELLIVVAIIAILAAIAVPNFLEAQTRAKVTRSKADCRNIATTVEAYRIDHKGATPAGVKSYGWACRWDYHIALSTPIAYMTSVPQDLFLRMWYNAPQMNPPATTTEYRKVFAQLLIWDHPITHAIMADPVGSAPGMWSPLSDSEITYLRPLMRDFYEPPFHMWNQAAASYYIRGRGPLFAEQTYYQTYDPSNGTVSSGDIFQYY